MMTAGTANGYYSLTLPRKLREALSKGAKGPKES